MLASKAQTNAQSVLSRLVQDEEFRISFEKNREEVLKSLDLPTEEMEALRDLDIGAFITATKTDPDMQAAKIGSIYI